MSQVTIYLDDELEYKMRKAAEAKNLSKSRWIATIRRVFNSRVGGQRAITGDAFPTASHQTGHASLKAPSFPVIQLSVDSHTIISTIGDLLMTRVTDDESLSSLGNHALHPNRFFNPPLPASA